MEKNIVCIKQEYSKFIKDGTELDLNAIAPDIADKMVCIYLDEDYNNLLSNQNKLDDYEVFISDLHDILKKLLIK